MLIYRKQEVVVLYENIHKHVLHEESIGRQPEKYNSITSQQLCHSLRLLV